MASGEGAEPKDRHLVVQHDLVDDCFGEGCDNPISVDHGEAAPLGNQCNELMSVQRDLLYKSEGSPDVRRSRPHPKGREKVAQCRSEGFPSQRETL
jgi:hypothetical protein